MTLTRGAVDTGAGNGPSVRFFAQGGDDGNYRIDGVDATSVRNQSESKSRLMISEDAIAEFRVNSQLYTAETGGATGGQVEIVSRGAPMNTTAACSNIFVTAPWIRAARSTALRSAVPHEPVRRGGGRADFQRQDLLLCFL